MQQLLDFISQPWPWYVAGPLIALVMFALMWFGERFGLSSNLRTICSMMGAGKHAEFFRFDWRADLWNLIFVVGTVVGGFLAHYFLSSDAPMALSPVTVAELQAFGVEEPGTNLVPASLFSWESLLTVRGIIILVVGGFLIGFGTRYAGGCTSGHAISGLSNLQIPSLVAVVGFFIGGLLVTYFVLPYLLIL